LNWLLQTSIARVSRALFLLDSDLDHIVTTTSTARSVFASVENNCAADHADAHDTSLITPRPSIGKKKAKEIAHGRSSRLNSKHQFDTPSSVESGRKAILELKNVQKGKRDLILTRIAEVAEAKHKFAQEKLLSQIYLQNPNSARAKAFFARMENRYDSEEEEVVAEPLARCASVPADVDSCQIHMLNGGRRAHCDYESDDNDIWERRR
jgi:hypothetical protein